MILIYVIRSFFLIQIELPDSVPWWVAVLLALANLAVPFAMKYRDGKKQQQDKEEDKEGLKDQKILSLVKANTSIATYLMFVLRDIEDSEKNAYLIEQGKRIIQESLKDDTSQNSTQPGFNDA